MDEPLPADDSHSNPSDTPSSTDEAYKNYPTSLHHLPPIYDSDSESDQQHSQDDSDDDPYFPNRQLQLSSSSNYRQAFAPRLSSSSIPHNPHSRSPFTSPPRTPQQASVASHPSTPAQVQQPRSLSNSSSSPASTSTPSSSISSPLGPPSTSFPITPLLPAHGAPSFVPMAQQPQNPAPPEPFDSSPPLLASSPPEDPLSGNDIRQRIRAISRDPSLSEKEKSKQRQALLSQPFHQRRKKEATAFSAEMRRQRYIKTYSNVDDPDTGEKMPGCEHYPRNCKIKAACCGLWVVCRLCHDHPSMDHAIVRFDTQEVMCMFCLTEQPVSRRCINEECNREFARYFCAKCKFYDNTPGKNIYHCDKCQICRVGKGIGHDNFHCDRCDACVSRETSKTHRCLKKSLDVNCPICGQYLHTSTLPVVYMRCGHTMHAHCFDTYTVEHYICPLCHKALTNMRGYYAQIDEAMKEQEMPEKHRNKVAEVLCHDCDKRSETAYHFLYLKCQTPDCGSYNTRLLRTIERVAGEGSGRRAEDADNGSSEDSNADMRAQRGGSLQEDEVMEWRSGRDSPERDSMQLS